MFEEFIVRSRQRTVISVKDGASTNPFTLRPDIKIKAVRVNLRRVNFINKGACGGAISFSGRSLKIQESSFVNNSASYSGGAIYGNLDRLYDMNGAKESKIQIQDCAFESKRCSLQGLFAKACRLQIYPLSPAFT